MRNVLLLGSSLILLAVAFYVSGFHKVASHPMPVTQPIFQVADQPVIAPVQPTIDVTKPPSNFDEVMSIAKQKNQQVLLVFGADWCPYCRKLDSETLSDASVKEAMSSYIVYHVNTDKESKVSHQYMKGSGIPAYSIISSDGKVIKQGSGFKTVSQFKSWLSGYYRRYRRRIFLFAQDPQSFQGPQSPLPNM